MAAHWQIEIEWDEDAQLVRLRDYLPAKSYIIEHAVLPPQRNQVVRWPCGGQFCVETVWPPDWQSYPTTESTTEPTSLAFFSRAVRQVKAPFPVDMKDSALYGYEDGEQDAADQVLLGFEEARPSRSNLVEKCSCTLCCAKETVESIDIRPTQSEANASKDREEYRKALARRLGTMPTVAFSPIDREAPRSAGEKSVTELPLEAVQGLEKVWGRGLQTNIAIIGYRNQGRSDYEELNRTLEYGHFAIKARQKQKAYPPHRTRPKAQLASVGEENSEMDLEQGINTI